MKISPLLRSVELRGGNNDEYLSNTVNLISSNVSTELARVTVNTKVDLETKNIDLNKLRFRQGSETKIDKFQNLLKIFFLFIFLCFTTLGANEFRTIIENRWEELRSKPTNPEQTWLIPQPSRSSWRDT